MGEVTPAMKLAVIDRKSFVKEKRKLVLNERFSMKRRVTAWDL